MVCALLVLLMWDDVCWIWLRLWLRLRGVMTLCLFGAGWALICRTFRWVTWCFSCRMVAGTPVGFWLFGCFGGVGLVGFVF